MSVEEYLQEHQGHLLTQGHRERKHSQLLKEISKHPERCTLPIEATFFQEVALRKDRELTGRVDLVAYTPHQLYLIEARVLHGRRDSWAEQQICRDLEAQLKRGFFFFRESFGATAKMIGVYRRRGQRGMNYFQPKQPAPLPVELQNT